MRGDQDSTAANPSLVWSYQVRAALSRARDEIGYELESERLPAVDPNGNPLVWPQLDARRARLYLATSTYIPFFTNRVDLLAVLRREIPKEVRHAPEIVDRARQFAEALDAELLAMREFEYAGEAMPPPTIPIGAAAYRAKHGEPEILPIAKRDNNDRWLPRSYAAVRLFRLNQSFARDIRDLLPEEWRETWDLAASIELLTPYAHSNSCERILDRIDASASIPDDVKATVREVANSLAPVRASLVVRLRGVQSALMTESGVKEWWEIRFDGIIAAINEEPGEPIFFQSEWTKAVDALRQHDADTQEQIKRLLTEAQWEAVSR